MRFWILLTCFLLVLSSCKTYEQYGGLRWTDGFEEAEHKLPMDAFVCRAGNDSAWLFIKFFGSQRNKNVKWPDSIRFTFKVTIDTTGGDKFFFYDSTSVTPSPVIINTKNDGTKSVKFLPKKNMRWMVVEVESAEPNITYKKNIDIQQQNSFAPVISDSSNTITNPLMLQANTPYSFQIKQPLRQVQYFEFPQRPAAPAYRVNEALPQMNLSDTTLSVDFSNHVRFVQPGLYRVRDTTSKDAFVILVHDNNFPEIISPNDLVKPLRYITRNEEYSKLIESLNPKQTVDSFWISRSKTEAVARRSIRIFYNRVEEANRLFTTTMPGWMTDRGMVLIIYGTPDRAYKFKEGEIWSYSDNFVRTLEFVFVRKEGFAGVDYELRRLQDYLQSWNQQSFKWRTGGILNDVPQLY